MESGQGAARLWRLCRGILTSMAFLWIRSREGSERLFRCLGDRIRVVNRIWRESS